MIVRRYELYAPRKSDSAPKGWDSGPTAESPSEGVAVARASDHPVIVMVDESTGNKYMRALPHKGLGVEGDLSWLVKNMHQEFERLGPPRRGAEFIDSEK